MDVPVANCCPLSVKTLVPAHDTVTNGRKKQQGTPRETGGWMRSTFDLPSCYSFFSEIAEG